MELITTVGTVFNVSKEAKKRFFEKKKKEAKEIRLKEITSGNFNNMQEDDLFSMIHRFERAVFEGTARKNLILMMRVANGMAEHKKFRVPGFLK